MKINPVFLCVASILLTASGGLNIGAAGFIDDVAGKYISALGVAFMILGISGMILSFYFLIKGENAEWERERERLLG